MLAMTSCLRYLDADFADGRRQKQAHLREPAFTPALACRCKYLRLKIKSPSRLKDERDDSPVVPPWFRNGFYRITGCAVAIRLSVFHPLLHSVRCNGLSRIGLLDSAD